MADSKAVEVDATNQIDSDAVVLAELGALHALDHLRHCYAPDRVVPSYRPGYKQELKRGLSGACFPVCTAPARRRAVHMRKKSAARVRGATSTFGLRPRATLRCPLPALTRAPILSSAHQLRRLLLHPEPPDGRHRLLRNRLVLGGTSDCGVGLASRLAHGLRPRRPRHG